MKYFVKMTLIIFHRKRQKLDLIICQDDQYSTNSVQYILHSTLERKSLLVSDLMPDTTGKTDKTETLLPINYFYHSNLYYSSVSFGYFYVYFYRCSLGSNIPLLYLSNMLDLGWSSDLINALCQLIPAAMEKYHVYCRYTNVPTEFKNVRVKNDLPPSILPLFVFLEIVRGCWWLPFAHLTVTNAVKRGQPEMAEGPACPAMTHPVPLSPTGSPCVWCPQEQDD